MESTIDSPHTKNLIIDEQKAKLERVLKQIEPGLAVEIIRYGANAPRSLISHTYREGNAEFYRSIIRLHFADSLKALREGQKLRIQLVRG